MTVPVSVPGGHDAAHRSPTAITRLLDACTSRCAVTSSSGPPGNRRVTVSWSDWPDDERLPRRRRGRASARRARRSSASHREHASTRRASRGTRQARFHVGDLGPNATTSARTCQRHRRGVGAARCRPLARSLARARARCSRVLARRPGPSRPDRRAGTGRDRRAVRRCSVMTMVSGRAAGRAHESAIRLESSCALERAAMGSAARSGCASGALPSARSRASSAARVGRASEAPPSNISGREPVGLRASITVVMYAPAESPFAKTFAGSIAVLRRDVLHRRGRSDEGSTSSPCAVRYGGRSPCPRTMHVELAPLRERRARDVDLKPRAWPGEFCCTTPRR